MNDKMKEMMDEALNNLKGMDALIPPIPEINYDTSDLRVPLFSPGFIDNIAALCFVGGFTCLGFVIGRLM